MSDAPKIDAVPPKKGDAPVAAGAAGPKLTRRRRFTRAGVIIAVVVLLAAIVLPVVSTLQPGYYQRYPSLRARMAGWRASTHSVFACSDCHVDPGVGGFLSFAAKSIPAFYSQVFFGPSSTNLLRAPSTAACLKCHTVDRQVSPSGDLRIPHSLHVVKLNIACVLCHKNLVHFPNSQGFNKPEMATCMTCHDGKKAKSDCVTCHTQKEVPDGHKQPDWLTIHPTMVGKIDCGKCHAYTPNFCATCHAQRPASHAGNWKYLHQFAAKTRGTKGCLFCHDQKKFCNTCH
jgi:hypothetical protein